MTPYRANKLKIKGKWVLIRGSNKKHTVLDDIDWLYKQLLTKSRAELAKELNVPYNSINYRLRYFSEEQRKLIKRERNR